MFTLFRLAGKPFKLKIVAFYSKMVPLCPKFDKKVVISTNFIDLKISLRGLKDLNIFSKFVHKDTPLEKNMVAVGLNG